MSKIVLTIESDHEENQSVTLRMDADPPFAKGQTLLTHTLGVSAMVRVQQRLLELNPDIVLAKDEISNKDGTVDNTEWSKGMHEKLKRITFKEKRWWQFWK